MATSWASRETHAHNSPFDEIPEFCHVFGIGQVRFGFAARLGNVCLVWDMRLTQSDDFEAGVCVTGVPAAFLSSSSRLFLHTAKELMNVILCQRLEHHSLTVLGAPLRQAGSAAWRRRSNGFSERWSREWKGAGAGNDWWWHSRGGLRQTSW